MQNYVPPEWVRWHVANLYRAAHPRKALSVRAGALLGCLYVSSVCPWLYAPYRG
jgi:hypothetical protein